MKTQTFELVQRIKANPRSFLIERCEDNYDLFLDLYEKVGYAPQTPNELSRWKGRSRETWRHQDTILPGSCTGGLFEGKVVSAFGALPITKSALWGHSGCMIKTLDAAISFLAQALHIVNRVQRTPGINCYVGSYAHKSRLTTLFQRPMSGCLKNRFEVEVVGFPYDFGISNESGIELRSELVTQDHLKSISEADCAFFMELCSCNPLFGTSYQATPLALINRRSGVMQCLALVQTAPPEVTAINLFSRTWIFPTTHVQVTSQFIQSFRSVPELGPSYLQVVLRRERDFALNDLNVPLLPAFWVMTPVEQLDSLREAYCEAFLPLIDKYSSNALADLEIRLDKR